MKVNFNSNLYHLTIDQIHQYDYGQHLEITGLNIPDSADVTFNFKRKNPALSATAKAAVISNTATASIPDAVFEYSGVVELYIYIDLNTSGRTEKRITMYIRECPRPSDYSTPTQIEAAKPFMETAADQINNARNYVENISRQITEQKSKVDSSIRGIEVLSLQKQDSIHQAVQSILETIPSDYSTLSEMVAGYAADTAQKASIIVGQAAGKKIRLNDSANMPLKSLSLEGKSSQINTNGLQLFNTYQTEKQTESIHFTVSEDGGITAKGTNTAVNVSSGISPVILTEGKKYTMSGGDKDIIIALTYMDSAGEKNWIVTKDTITFVCLSSWTDTQLYVQVQKQGALDLTIYPMVNEGEQAVPYEPYSGGKPSPSPEYPQPVTCAGKDDLWIASSIGQRNIAFKTNQGAEGWDWLMQAGDYTKEELLDNGIRCCKLVKGAVPQQGWNIVAFRNIGRQHYKPDTTYTITFEVMSSMDGEIIMKVARTDGQKNLIKSRTPAYNALIPNTWCKCTFIVRTQDELPPDKDQALYLQGFSSEPGSTHIFKNLKIIEGETANDLWCPAPEDINAENADELKNYICKVNIPGTYHGNDSSSDIICEYNGQIGKLSYWKEQEFKTRDTSEHNILSNSKEVRFNNPGVREPYTFYSNKFKWVPNTWSRDELYICSVAGPALERVAFRIAPSLDKNNYFEENPVTLLYRLEEPVFIPFDEDIQTQIRSLKTYYPQTFIYNSDECPMNVKYYTDTQNNIAQNYVPLSIYQALEKRIHTLETKLQ